MVLNDLFHFTVPHFLDLQKRDINAYFCEGSLRNLNGNFCINVKYHYYCS